MKTVMQVSYLNKEIGNKKLILSLLLDLDRYSVKVETLADMKYWLSEYFEYIKRNLTYEEVLSLEPYKPTIEISAEHTCHHNNKTNHYKMESNLFGIYGLHEKQKDELATDIFLALVGNWIKLNNKCHEEEK